MNGKAYHVSLQVFFFLALEPLQVLQNACTSIFDIAVRYFYRLLQLEFLSATHATEGNLFNKPA
jgi:hypothetical protein